jgi:chromosome segregation ATPase
VITEGGEGEPDVIQGRYHCSDGTAAAGSFRLQVGAARPAGEDALLQHLAMEEEITGELRRRVEAYRRSEDEMRASVNLLQIDKENLAEEHRELKLRAEAAEAKIDRERRLKQESDDKCERLMMGVIEYKMREEALVRQLKEKETVAKKAVEAFNGLRAECATLLKQAAGLSAPDLSGTEAGDALQAKLTDMAQ